MGGQRCAEVVVVSLLIMLHGEAKSQPQRGESVGELCAEGLSLHGRGQWAKALQVFAAAVGDELALGLTHNNLEQAVDCIFGAALSLNTLGRAEDSLGAFRLSQRLQSLHARGTTYLSEQGNRRCRSSAASRSSAPYMSCNTVRAMADHIHDALDGNNCRFSPDIVAHGDVVYANALLLDDFMINKVPFEKINPVPVNMWRNVI
jgi:hypothetical protein